MRVGWVLLFLAGAALKAAGTTYYVDCEAGSDQASGTSPETAWRSLTKVSQQRSAPGDEILLRRGTRCEGMLWPKGSGTSSRPIRLGAYGHGPLPVIDARGAEAAIKLFDQEGWHVENLEAVGGNPYGVLVSGAKGRLRHFRLTNLVVRDVTGQVRTKSSGLVAILAPPELHMEDVVLDGITAFRTTQWAGIIVRGGSCESRIRDVVVRNCIVHHVYGDGIVLFQVENGLIETSAAWLTGLNPSAETGTPNGIWTWRCRNCVVRFTEGFLTDSPGVDGGVYDIDWGNENNVVEHNYAHDAQGYCVSVFGAQNEVTVNSVVRYNVCVNNGRSPKLARRQGDFYVTTWDGGALDGLVVHNNTFYWSPPDDVPAVKVESAEFRGSRPNVFRNNVIFSAVPSLVHAAAPLRFEQNVYWHPGAAEPLWRYDGREYRGIGAWQAMAGVSERLADPRWDAMLRPQPGSPLLDTTLGLRAGALGWRPATPPRKNIPLAARSGRWTLQVHCGRDRASCRAQLVFVQAALAQYGRLLDAVLLWEDAAGNAANLIHDWNLGQVRLERSPRSAPTADAPVTLLADPRGRVVARWEGFSPPAELGLALRYHLGPPPGAGAPHPLWPWK